MNLPKVGHSNSPFFWMLNDSMKLVTLNDKTVIAEFHRPTLFRNKQKARLDIQPAGMDMLDHIILTFVFVDWTRREREAGAWHTVPWAIP